MSVNGEQLPRRGIKSPRNWEQEVFEEQGEKRVHSRWSSARGRVGGKRTSGAPSGMLDLL